MPSDKLPQERKPVTIICGVKRPMGAPPVLVERDAWCEDCHSRHDMEKCPQCGSWISIGYGLMYGYYGEYKDCMNFCGWFFIVREDTGE